MPSRSIFAAVACVALTAVGAGACSPSVHPRGQLLEEADLAAVAVGAHKEEVRRTLGSPSLEALFSPDVWLYFSGESRRVVNFLPRRVVNQTVLALHFENGLLTRMETIEPPPVGRSLIVARETTPTRGKTIGIFERIFGNIGKFTPGGTPGG